MGNIAEGLRNLAENLQLKENRSVCWSMAFILSASVFALCLVSTFVLPSVTSSSSTPFLVATALWGCAMLFAQHRVQLWLRAGNDLRVVAGEDYRRINHATLQVRVTTHMNWLFNSILEEKDRLAMATSPEEKLRCRFAIVLKREYYERIRKSMRLFGFEVRSERKLLKALRRAGKIL
jgi:hypothetical protein